MRQVCLKLSRGGSKGGGVTDGDDGGREGRGSVHTCTHHGSSSSSACVRLLAQFASGAVRAERARIAGVTLHGSLDGGGSSGPHGTPAGLPTETDENRVQQRAKQADHGRNTMGYMRYRWLVPRAQRGFRDPHSPDVTRAHSKKGWETETRRWRRQLHAFDLHRDPWAQGGGDGGREEGGGEDDKDEVPADTLSPAQAVHVARTGCSVTYVAQDVPAVSREVIDVAYGGCDASALGAVRLTVVRGRGGGGQRTAGRKRKRAQDDGEEGEAGFLIDRARPSRDVGEAASDSESDEASSCGSEGGGEEEEERAVSGGPSAGKPARSDAPMGPGYLEASLPVRSAGAPSPALPLRPSLLSPGPTGLGGAGTSRPDEELLAPCVGYYDELFARYHTRDASVQPRSRPTHGGAPVHAGAVERRVGGVHPSFPPLQTHRGGGGGGGSRTARLDAAVLKQRHGGMVDDPLFL